MQTRAKTRICRHTKYAFLAFLFQKQNWLAIPWLLIPRWRFAVAEEYKALLHTNTWTMVSTFRGKNIVANK